MKIQFTETRYYSVFELEPETPEEVAQLFRMTNNSKAEKPEIYLSFGNDDKSKIYCVASFKKMKDTSNKIVNSIKNY